MQGGRAVLSDLGAAVALPRAATWRVGGFRASLEVQLEVVLRLAVAACFIGHGAFGIITKAQWVPYFALVGIPESIAYRLMPLVGLMDIALGLLTLVLPLRAVLLHMAFWATWTAALRPLTGEGPWEFAERAGNYGVPLAFLALCGGAPLRAWFTARAVPSLTPARAQAAARILRLTTALLLIGHGGFGAFMHKGVWFTYFGVLGIDAATVRAAALIPAVGWGEIALGVAILARPARQLLLLACAWKVGTELLRLPAGEPVWEVIERAGSYGAPLALLLVQRWREREAVALQESTMVATPGGRPPLPDAA